MAAPLRLKPLPFDSDFASLVSLSVELQPLRTAGEVAALLRALRQYPLGLPRRDQLMADALGNKCTIEQLSALVSKLELTDADLLKVSSCLPQAERTVNLIPPVAKCVACAAAPTLTVKPRYPSSPTVVTEAGLFQGVLHAKVCPECDATHYMSYAEGGSRIPAGKQLPYALAAARETRFVQFTPGYVFGSSLLRGYEAQALFSHTGYEPWALEYAWKTGGDGTVLASSNALRFALAHTWLAWELLRWLDELAMPLGAMGLTLGLSRGGLGLGI